MGGLNQDAWCSVRIYDRISIFCVFDGHGVKGENLADYVRTFLPKIIIRDPRFPDGEIGAVLTQAFETMQKIIEAGEMCKEAERSGTTATVVVHDLVERRLICANVGDSEAHVQQVSGDDEPALTPTKLQTLTAVHHPDLQEERQRIEAAGGRIIFDGYANHHVYAHGARTPGLNISRCIGHTGHKDCGLTATPTIKEHLLRSENELLVICSGGVWEVMTHQEVADFLKRNSLAADDIKTVANDLATEAWTRWLQEEQGTVVDDITVLLLKLPGIKRVLNVIQVADDSPYSSGGLSVAVLGLDGSTVTTLRVASNQRVCWLRECIAEQLGVPVYDLRLVVGGALLGDSQVIAENPAFTQV